MNSRKEIVANQNILKHIFKSKIFKKMLKKLLHISVCVLLLIIPTSCNKWLDLQPQDGITKDKFWKTKEQRQGNVSVST